ncbi:hypothetical protein BX600DRAFT_171303 [Xylariales sp. PMI_506]|nr:hypothetical protein BX600DRAFT_171303 [Xylariales sp. PMI_506]
MAASPIVLILGAGPRLGSSVASKFAELGYQVAIASRKGVTGTRTEQGYLSQQADFAEGADVASASIPALFDAVAEAFGGGAVPSVVIYNAAAYTTPPDADSVLSIPAAAVAADLNVNTISAYVAAQEAVKRWAKQDEEEKDKVGGAEPSFSSSFSNKEAKRTFIYTGNIMNVSIVPVAFGLNLGMGKAASAFWVGAADALYASKRYRFFYADERNEDGSLKGMDIDGPAHGEFYAQLVSQENDIPWHATFVKDKGYVQFK